LEKTKIAADIGTMANKIVNMYCNYVHTRSSTDYWQILLQLHITQWCYLCHFVKDSANKTT